jgi:hypothetical protein
MLHVAPHLVAAISTAVLGHLGHEVDGEDLIRLFQERLATVTVGPHRQRLTAKNGLGALRVEKQGLGRGA